MISAGLLMAAALGTEAAPPPPTLIRAPTLNVTSARYYPAAARAKAADGVAWLECRLTPKGRVTECLVLKETPAELGFGAAAVTYAHKTARVRVGPEMTGGEVVRFPVRFSLAALKRSRTEVSGPDGNPTGQFQDGFQPVN